MTRLVFLAAALCPFVLSAVEARVPGERPARPSTLLSASTVDAAKQHPEAKPFNHAERATREVDAALARARVSGHRVLAIFGANDCHDSRALAGWFATPRFAAMLEKAYEIVWIDVGRKTKNIDLARRFGLNGIAGTPTLLMLDRDGRPLNLTDAPTWRNAASRSEDAIYTALATAPGK